MWSASCFQDPVGKSAEAACLVHARVSFAALLGNANHQAAFQEGGRAARVALADFCLRKISERFRQNGLTVEYEDQRLALEPLDSLVNRRRHHTTSRFSHTPFILERSDAWCTDNDLNFILRASGTSSWQQNVEQVKSMTISILSKFLSCQDAGFLRQALNHVACAVLQHRLRDKLNSMKAVAFIADGAVLPRKSGANDAPMASPPAIPCEAPKDSPMRQQVEVDLGALRPFLSCLSSPVDENHPTKVALTGLVVPAGITLIAGGGYHGKSTLLRAIAAGVYDKVPGDGREFCVTVPDAMSIRAEDGRYVNKCNVSAFISNLPTAPGATSTIDTTHFCSGEASGSTSQAANVSEAMEMGAKVFLVDEDVSAANFMARDGRMRALVMDESITPLLYRVNGMYHTHGISCVVVVGGVGDWLDVPDQVILMNKYVTHDATKKAQSISYQFSYGHVQYGGRGVVHRLEWDKGGTPAPRRPDESFLDRFNPERMTVSLLDGGHAISIHRSHNGNQEEVMADDPSEDSFDDDDDGYIDLSRCEQLLGKKPQLFGCGLCVIWLLREAKRNPDLGIQHLLDKLDQALDHGGMLPVFVDAVADAGVVDSVMNSSDEWANLLSTAAYVYRPRKFEVGQALCRMRGILMKHLPVEDDGSEEAAREAERKKQELLDLWAARRAKKGDQ